MRRMGITPGTPTNGWTYNDLTTTLLEMMDNNKDVPAWVNFRVLWSLLPNRGENAESCYKNGKSWVTEVVMSEGRQRERLGWIWGWLKMNDPWIWMFKVKNKQKRLCGSTTQILGTHGWYNQSISKELLAFNPVSGTQIWPIPKHLSKAGQLKNLEFRTWPGLECFYRCLTWYWHDPWELVDDE
jgi:hypothetical protein